MLLVFDGLYGLLNHFDYLLGKRCVQDIGCHFLSLFQFPVEELDQLLAIRGILLTKICGLPSEFWHILQVKKP